MARRRIKFLMVFGVLIILVLGTYYLLYVSNLFVLRNIEVENNHRVSKKEILGYVGLKGGERLFKIPIDTIRKRILKDRRIKDVVIIRCIPDTLKIVLKERKPIAIVYKKGIPYLVDDKGVLIAKAKSEDFNFYPVLELKSKSLSPKVYEFLVWLKHNEKYIPVFESIQKVVAREDTLILKTKDGMSIYFPLNSKKSLRYFYRNLDRIMTYLYEKKMGDKVEEIRFDYPLGEALVKFRKEETTNRG